MLTVIRYVFPNTGLGMSGFYVVFSSVACGIWHCRRDLRGDFKRGEFKKEAIRLKEMVC